MNSGDSESYQDDKVEVYVTDQAGVKTFKARLPVDTSLSRLIPVLVDKMRLPSNQYYNLQHKQSGSFITSSQTLQSAHVNDGDTIRILPDVLAGGGVAISNYRDIQLITTKLTSKDIEAYSLYAIFLYTKADQLLARFVRESFEEMHHMAGSKCVFYVVEKPDEKWLPLMREELTETLGPHILQVWRLLEANQFEPIDSSNVYELAEELGVERRQIPCAIFFTNLDDDQLLIVPFSHLIGELSAETEQGELLRMFRELFDQMDTASQEPLSKRLGKLKRSIGTSKKFRSLAKGKADLLSEVTLKETVKSAIGVLLGMLIGIQRSPP